MVLIGHIFLSADRNLIKGMGLILTLTWSGSKNVEGSMRAGLSDSLESYNTMENIGRITITPWPFELVLLAVTIRDVLLYSSKPWHQVVKNHWSLRKVNLVLRKALVSFVCRCYFCSILYLKHFRYFVSKYFLWFFNIYDYNKYFLSTKSAN